MVVSRWEGELDTEMMARKLNNETDIEAEDPELIVEGLESADAEPAATNKN